MFCKIITINNYRGDLNDISAKKNFTGQWGWSYWGTYRKSYISGIAVALFRNWKNVNTLSILRNQKRRVSFKGAWHEQCCAPQRLATCNHGSTGRFWSTRTIPNDIAMQIAGEANASKRICFLVQTQMWFLGPIQDDFLCKSRYMLVMNDFLPANKWNILRSLVQKKLYVSRYRCLYSR